MIYRISHTTAYAYYLLGQFSSGTVHSAYDRTINLALDGHLLSFQTAGSPISPLSLITELNESDMKHLHISPENQVKISGFYISFSNCSFSFEKAQIYNTELTAAMPNPRIQDLRSKLRDVLSSSEMIGFQPILADSMVSSLSPVNITAKNHLLNCTTCFLSGSYEQAASSLTALIGLGSGLTPSGDDFLCGVLAGLKFCGKSEQDFANHLRLQIHTHLPDTNDISAAFLKCALKGQYSMAVNSLSHLPAATEIFSAFRAIGHSSGIDTLCGILYALNLYN